MTRPENHSRIGSSRHADSPILRKLRGWVALHLRSPADLRELCNSYGYVGAMGLPRDIIEQILCFLREDMRTLKAVSLTCRALFSATRRLIYRRVRLITRGEHRPRKLVDRIAMRILPTRKVHEAHVRHISAAGKRGLLGYAKELVVYTGMGFSPRALDEYLPQFRSFRKVEVLRIHFFDLTSFLPTFERHFTQFVPTLRSLHLPNVVGDAHEALEFICKFPHLNDLSLTQLSAHPTDLPQRLPCMEHSPPLRGKLTLRGWGSTSVPFLLEIPGGLHFRSIDVGGIDKAELGEILDRCSSTLEVLSFFPRSIRDTVDLSRSLALKRFELRADPDDLPFIPYRLRQTLSTIASPVFSEFTLKLEGLIIPHRTFRDLADRTVWIGGWDFVDSVLNDMVDEIGRDIRLVVHVATNGGVWSCELEGFMREVFPLMGARGLVTVLGPMFDEGERFIW